MTRTTPDPVFAAAARAELERRVRTGQHHTVPTPTTAHHPSRQGSRSPWTIQTAATIGVVLVSVAVLTVFAFVRPPTANTAAAPPPASGVTTPTTSVPAAGPTSATGQGNPTAGASGCSNGETAVPEGAATVSVNDVDGDGKSDTAFFTATEPYEFGFATSAGGIYTTPDRQTPTGDHHAWTVNTDGFPGHVIAIDDGLAAYLLTFQNCSFQDLTNADGSALYVPIGALSAGADATTGVACGNQNGGITIQAVQARLLDNGRYDIAWSTLEPVGTATGATFTAPEVRYSDLDANDPLVQEARTSTCWAADTLTVTRPDNAGAGGDSK